MMAPLTILGAAVASLIDHWGLWAIAVIAGGLALILGIVEAVAYAIRAQRSQVIQVPPAVEHRPIGSFRAPAAKGFDRHSYVHPADQRRQLASIAQFKGGRDVR